MDVLLLYVHIWVLFPPVTPANNFSVCCSAGQPAPGDPNATLIDDYTAFTFCLKTESYFCKNCGYVY